MVIYLDMSQIGALFNVSGATVSKWRTRYADTHPCPEPDAMIGDTPGWLPGRKREWQDWHAGRTGQGAPGKPKPRRQQHHDHTEDRMRDVLAPGGERLIGDQVVKVCECGERSMTRRLTG